MLYQRRMRLPHVEDPTLNGTPLERMMLSLTSAGIAIDKAAPTVSMQDMPGRDGRLDLTLTDPTGAAYMGNRTITLNLYAIGGEDDTSPPKPASPPSPAPWSRSHGAACPANTRDV